MLVGRDACGEPWREPWREVRGEPVSDATAESMPSATTSETLLRPSMAGLVTIIEGRTMAMSKAEATPLDVAWTIFERGLHKELLLSCLSVAEVEGRGESCPAADFPLLSIATDGRAALRPSLSSICSTRAQIQPSRHLPSMWSTALLLDRCRASADLLVYRSS